MTFITLFRAFISRTGLAFLTGAMCLLPGATIAVNGTGDPIADGQTLQNAVNSAQPGDVISVQPGFSYQGQITWPAKPNPNGSYITIQSAAPASSLPAAGVPDRPGVLCGDAQDHVRQWTIGLRHR